MTSSFRVFVFAERTFDAAKHFDTLPELVDRKFNRPTREMLQKKKQLELNEETIVVSVRHEPCPTLPCLMLPKQPCSSHSCPLNLAQVQVFWPTFESVATDFKPHQSHGLPLQCEQVTSIERRASDRTLRFFRPLHSRAIITETRSSQLDCERSTCNVSPVTCTLRFT